MRALLSLLVAGATMFACAQIAGIDDTPAPKDGGGPSGDGGGAGDTSGDPNVEISETLDFGSVACRTTSASPQVIAIHNKGATGTSYSVDLPDGSPLKAAEPLKGPLPPKTTVTIHVTASPTELGDFETDVPVTTDSNAYRVIHAKVTGTGATMQISPALATFGDVRNTAGATMPITIANGGTDNLEITAIDSAAPAHFAVTPTTVSVPPKGTKDVTLAIGPSSDKTETETADFTFTTATAVCGTVPKLSASGALKDIQVTVAAADFDKQTCNATIGTKTITVTNYTNSALSVSAALNAPSTLFTITTPSPVAIAKPTSPSAPTTGTFVVALQGPVPATPTKTPVQEAITVTVKGTPSTTPSDGSYPTYARLDVRGSVLTLSPSTIALSCSCDSNGCTQSSKNFNVSNTGNEDVGVSFGIANGSGWNLGLFGNYIPAGINGTAGTVYWRSRTDNNAASLGITGTFTGHICNQVTPIALSGTGGGN